MEERTYAVTWRTPEGQETTCKNLSPRIAFARLWAAWKFHGGITVINIDPEWTTNNKEIKADWPYPIAPPECTEREICVTHDTTGFWCGACTLWGEENAAIL